MPLHPDLDLLALQALGEPVLDHAATVHVAGCDECSRTVQDLARTVSTVRGPREDVDLTASGGTGPEAAATRVPVPAHVWQGIAAELDLDPSVRPASVGPSIVPAAARSTPATSPVATAPAAPGAGTAGGAVGSTVVAERPSTPGPDGAGDEPPAAPRDWSGRRRDRGAGLRRAAPLLAVAAAGLVVGVAGTTVVTSLGGPAEPEPQVLAATDLDAFGIGEGTTVTGSARLAERAVADPGPAGDVGPDRVLQVELDQLPDSDGDGFLEAWLIDPVTGSMVSLGLVDSRGQGAVAVELTVPRGLDVDTYSLVDVSAEPLDGDPTHSGDSLLRGTLST